MRDPEDFKRRTERLIYRIPSLTQSQVFWLEKVIETFDCRHKYTDYNTGFLDKWAIESFGDALRIHHSFSAEPFSKDKFEYVLCGVLNICGYKAELAPKGNPGFDILIENSRVSLKTQADKNIKRDKVWISKFMELGKGKWGANKSDLVGLRKSFLRHLTSYERIIMLRNLRRGPDWLYELIEIPKQLLASAKDGVLEMMHESKQMPKPGYCYVPKAGSDQIFQLYFDGGSERKLQIKNLSKDRCILLAEWEFTIPEK